MGVSRTMKGLQQGVVGGGGVGGSCMYAYVWLWVIYVCLWVGADFTAQAQKVYLPLLQKACSVPSLVSNIMPPFFETIQWRNCTMGETLQWGELRGRKGCTRTMGGAAW